MQDWMRNISEWAYRHEVAGLLGAIASARWAPAGARKWEIVTGIIGAWFAAVYLTDPVVAWLQLGGMRGVQYGAAFLIGLFALNIAGAAMDLIRSGRLVALLPGGRALEPRKERDDE